MMVEIGKSAVEREEKGKEFLENIHEFEKNIHRTILDICEATV